MDIKSFIRDVPDFPKPGILFKDITPLLKDPAAYEYVIGAFADHFHGRPVDVVVSVEARGFLFAAPVALRMGKPLVPVRKGGKLPSTTRAVQYTLEYGTGVVEIHDDAIHDGQSVLIVDDLLATGGTLAATAQLVEESGGRVEGLAVLVELQDLAGRERLAVYDLFSLIAF